MTLPPAAEINKAVDELRAGRLVIIPTDTVYGLAADPTNPRAIEALFALKGRPETNPIPLLVGSIESAKQCTTDWPHQAEQLARAFWPGPLTLVVPRAPHIPNAITAGTNTVGVRQPNHPTTLALLTAFDGPLACTSANLSGEEPASSISDLPDHFLKNGPVVLDAGPLPTACASTVLDMSDKNNLVIRRQGDLTQSALQKVLTPPGE